MKEIKEKHPFFIRWTHWINFPLLTIMIWSGLLIYWADSEYSIGVVKFFPKWFYKVLNVPHRLGEGMSFHFLFMWLFILNGFFYVLYTIVSGV